MGGGRARERERETETGGRGRRREGEMEERWVVRMERRTNEKSVKRKLWTSPAQRG